ncbi:hypothetical protein KQX54_008824 [Cotesia glomerata]|uniref:Uncharacterized protein n=1 Tax=Cotesia glomerata TaxID=32391 RepID=A0AAV7I2C0_COTGL|nr:hypothetical protein KQX54_008824 [Cotesia glomerata]
MNIKTDEFRGKRSSDALNPQTHGQGTRTLHNVKGLARTFDWFVAENRFRDSGTLGAIEPEVRKQGISGHNLKHPTYEDHTCRNPATPNIIGRFRMTRKRPMSCRCEYKSEREAVKPIAVAMVTPVERRATSGLLRDALARGTRHYTSPPAGYLRVRHGNTKTRARDSTSTCHAATHTIPASSSFPVYSSMAPPTASLLSCLLLSLKVRWPPPVHLYSPSAEISEFAKLKRSFSSQIGLPRHEFKPQQPYSGPVPSPSPPLPPPPVKLFHHSLQPPSSFSHASHVCFYASWLLRASKISTGWQCCCVGSVAVSP